VPCQNRVEDGLEVEETYFIRISMKDLQSVMVCIYCKSINGMASNLNV